MVDLKEDDISKLIQLQTALLHLFFTLQRPHLTSPHLSLTREGRWCTTHDFTNSFVHFFFSVLHCPGGLGELQACPLPDVVFPPLPLSALSSSPFHCALQDGFGQT